VTSQTAQVRAFCDAGDQVISGGYQSVYGDIVTTSLPVLGSPNGWQAWINKAGSAASGQTVIFQVTAVCADTAN
jgi:hypothetical protein